MKLDPRTMALLETQAALVAALDGREPPARGENAELDAAIEAAGHAGVAWMAAGGPDRDSEDEGLRELLGPFWARRHDSKVRQLVREQRLLDGLPRDVRQWVADLPRSYQAVLARSQDRILNTRRLEGLLQALSDLTPYDFEAVVVIVNGFKTEVEAVVISAGVQFLQVMASAQEISEPLHHCWSYFGLALRVGLVKHERPMRSQSVTMATGGDALALFSPTGQIASLQLVFPKLETPPQARVQTALYALIADLLDAPPMEET